MQLTLLDKSQPIRNRLPNMNNYCYRPVTVEKEFSPNTFQRECLLTDAFSVSGLFPSCDEVEIDSYLIRQHLLQESRREVREIASTVPEIRKLFMKHCSANTPVPTKHITLQKRMFPPSAYINIEPRKSVSQESLECVEAVTELAALNTNDRSTIGRSLVCHQSKLHQVDRNELRRKLNENLKGYYTPPDTYGINKMKEAVENLYALEMELPFMKALKARARSQRLAMSHSPSKTPTESIDTSTFIPKSPTVVIPRRANLPRLKKEAPSEGPQLEKEPFGPYMMGFFVGKSRTVPVFKPTAIPDLSVVNCVRSQ